MLTLQVMVLKLHNIHAKEMKIRVEEIELDGMTHVMKEEKFGVVRGILHP